MAGFSVQVCINQSAVARMHGIVSWQYIMNTSEDLSVTVRGKRHGNRLAPAHVRAETLNSTSYMATVFLIIIIVQNADRAP